jgi:hypothetical protein
MYRHNGGIAVKRQWGSSTITEFWVYLDYKKADGSYADMVKVRAYGKTPGERKTYAIAQATLLFQQKGLLP